MSGRTARRRVLKITLPGDGQPGAAASRADFRADFLAAEEPLGIRVNGAALTMTMRTPGDDVELAAGFLVGEAVIRTPADLAEIRLCDGTSCGHGDHDGMGNIADVTLAAGVTVAAGARRSFLTTSACGVCGKASIADICVLPAAALADDLASFAPAVLACLPGRLREAQRVFSRTGGLHAAGLFTSGGDLIGGHPAARRGVRAILARRRPGHRSRAHPGRVPARPVDERLHRGAPGACVSNPVSSRSRLILIQDPSRAVARGQQPCDY